MDPSFYFTDHDDELSEAIEEGRKRRFVKRFVVFAVILALLGGAALFVTQRYFSPIDPAKATKDKAVSWLVLRDLSKEPAETREQLFEMYIGNVSVPESTDAEGAVYALPKSVQKFSGMFLSGRDEKVAAWRKKTRRLPALRVDYIVSGSDERAGQYVTSSDVVPGPALVERWETRQKALESGKGRQKPTKAERNVQLLIMQWFVSRCKTYDATPDVSKRAKLDELARDLQNFQDFYNNIRISGKKDPLTRSEMLSEFEMTIDSWLEVSTPEELAKILWFKDLLVAVVVQQMSGGSARLFEYPPVIPKKSAPAGPDNLQERKDRADAAFKKALDSVKGYAFGKQE